MDTIHRQKFSKNIKCLNDTVNQLHPIDIIRHNQFICSVVSHSFWPPWAAALQVFLSSTISQSLFKFMYIELGMLSNHLILCHPLLCLQSFPASGSFQISQHFESGGQSIGVSASASVLLSVNIHPLEWTGWISLQSKGLSRVSSHTTFQKYQFFGTQLSL